MALIACISAAGYALSLYIMLKDKNLTLAWAKGVPHDWIFDSSLNEWTTDEYGL